MLKNLSSSFSRFIAIVSFCFSTHALATVNQLPPDLQLNNSAITPTAISSQGVQCGDQYTVCVDNMVNNQTVYGMTIWATIATGPSGIPRLTNVANAYASSLSVVSNYAAQVLSETSIPFGGSTFNATDCYYQSTNNWNCYYNGTFYNTPATGSYSNNMLVAVDILKPTFGKERPALFTSTAQCNCDTKDVPSLNVLDKLKTSLAPSVGNPVDVVSASAIEVHTDLTSFIPLIRTYSSGRYIPTTLGFGWKHNWDKQMTVITTLQTVKDPVTGNTSIKNIPTLINIVEEDDTQISFIYDKTNNVWTNTDSAQPKYKLTANSNNYTLTTPSHSIETYSLSGQFIQLTLPSGMTYNLSYNANQLVNITDSYNHNLSFSYNGSNISQITESNGDYINYSYNNGNLIAAVYNNNETVQYTYNVNNLLLTTVDELGNMQTNNSYNSKNNVIENWLSNGSSRVQDLSITPGNINTPVSVVNSNTSTYKKYSLARTSNAILVTSDNMANNFNNITNTYNFDTNGNITSYVDGNNNSYGFTYDSNGNPLTMSKPNNDNTTYTWDTITLKPIKVVESSPTGTRTTSLTYDNNLNLLTRIISSNSGTLNWTYTYGTYGKITSITEPNGNVITYNYYPDNYQTESYRGQIASITNGLNQTITINSYDNRGNITSITGANGVTKLMTYDQRNRLLTESINGATNTYTYNASGDLLQVAFANGYILNLNYDLIHRVIGINDNNGNQNVLTLNDDGDITNEQIKQGSSLITIKNRIFDGLHNLQYQWHNNTSAKEKYTYDAAGNLHTMTDSDGRVHNLTVDKMGNVSSDQMTGLNKNYGRDIDENITSVTWGVSANQTTNMTYDDFGQITQLISPDSGTSNFTHDIPNGIDTKTDANGVTHTVTKDVLGRPIQIQHGNLIETLTYDSSLNGTGQIASLTDSSGSTSWSYNNLGLVSSKTQTINGKSFTIQYGYDNAGQLTSMTYPSGLVVNYTYTNGQITSVGTSAGSLITSVNYAPFTSNPTSWNWSSGSYSKTYSQNETLTNISSGGVLSNSLNQDEVGNILSISNNSFTYNNSDNLLSAFNLNYNYDNNLNLTSFGSTTMTVNQNKIATYVKPTTNTYAYDNNGNTLSDSIEQYGNNKYGYDVKNNLVRVINSTYTFNGLNQRVSKTVNGVTTYFVYNESHQLIGEYDNNGNLISEHIYLDLTPIGLYKNSQIYNVHTDHLGTPRVITTSGNQIVWQWNNTDPLGSNLPSVSTIEYNLRFAGQYFDKESNLHYNYYRTYNPLTGKYLQPDPIGLNGGLNTYNYVNGNPLSAIDPLGLTPVNFPLTDGYYGLTRWTFMAESFFKSHDTDPDILNINSHANVNVLSGNSAQQLVKQIISGKFYAHYKDGSEVQIGINNYFDDRIKNNKDIIINLDACNTGAYYYNTELKGNTETKKVLKKPYGFNVGSGLKDFIKNNYPYYEGRVIVKAPNGMIRWMLGVDSPDYAPDYNKKAQINTFIF